MYLKVEEGMSHYQEKAPLFEAMLAHRNQARGNFHVPGHKQGNAFDSEGKIWFQPLLELDLTEVGDLDDLHDPHGVIASAQQLAAECFRADHTLFLVGGTTAGNLAVILTLCAPGDQILIQRSCHQSVIHGCLLAGAQPILMPVEWDQNGRELPLRIEAVEQVLQQYSNAKAVMITSPTYHGWVQPVKELVNLCQRYGIPIIVDEAHGAHFGFHPSLPLSAMDLGVDVAIQSTHKMLTSMTMSSMLHVRGSRIQVEKISRWLRVIESSSPSYPLMASLDLARRYIWKCGFKELDRVLHLLQELRNQIRSFRHFQEIIYPSRQDPFKLNLQARGLSGFTLAKLFEEQGYYCEWADHEKVLFVFSMGTTKEEIHRLIEVMNQLDRQFENHVDEEKEFHHRRGSQQHCYEVMKKVERGFVQSDTGSVGRTWESSVLSMESLSAWRLGSKMRIPLNEACGFLSAQLVVPYPPGIPLLFPGEAWTEEKVREVQSALNQGWRVRGVTSQSSGEFLVDVLHEKGR